MLTNKNKVIVKFLGIIGVFFLFTNLAVFSEHRFGINANNITEGELAPARVSPSTFTMSGSLQDGHASVIMGSATVYGTVTSSSGFFGNGVGLTGLPSGALAGGASTYADFGATRDSTNTLRNNLNNVVSTNIVTAVFTPIATSTNALRSNLDNIVSSNVTQRTLQDGDIGDNVLQGRTLGFAVLLGTHTGESTLTAANIASGTYVSSAAAYEVGTINTGTNPVDWSKLKGVPAGFSDGTDDTGEGGGASLTSSNTWSARQVFANQIAITSNSIIPSTVSLDVGGRNANFNSAWDGGLITFTTTTAIPASLGRPGVFAANGFIYVLGGTTDDGTNNVNTVYYGRINGDGTVSGWVTNNPMPGNRWAPAVIYANGFVYIIGGYATSAQNTVFYAKVFSNGSIGNFSQTSIYPSSNYGIRATYYKGFIYTAGGVNTGSESFYAKQNADGTLGTWQTGALMPAARAHGGMVNANGFVYYIGGESGGSGQTNVYYSALATTGGYSGSWTTNSNALPAGRGGQCTIIENGYLYVIAGVQAAVQGTVYFAAVNLDGTVGTFTTQNNLSYNKAQLGGCVSCNGYIYLTAGANSGGTTLSTVTFTTVGRIKVASHIDMVGISSNALAYGGQGGSSIYAGKIAVKDTLNVSGNSNFYSGASVLGNFSVLADSVSVSTSVMHIFANDNSTALDIMINAAQADITFNDTYINFRSTSGSEGGITGSGSAGVLVYTTFAGAHLTSVNVSSTPLLYLLDATGIPVGEFSKRKVKIKKSKIVNKDTQEEVIGSSSGITTEKIQVEEEIELPSLASPKKQVSRSVLCTHKKCKSAWGFYGGIDKYGRDMVLSIGTGFAYVVNTGSNVVVGDYLTSSDQLGGGMVELQDDDLLHSYTKAKALEPIIWNEGETFRKIAVTYHCG